MDFTFTTEQRSLRDTARAYLASRSGTGDDPMVDRSGDEQCWKELTELGWLDPDLSAVDLAVLAEETGYARFPAPWLVTVGLAAPVLRRAGRSVTRPATLAWAEPAPGPALLSDAVAGVRCRVDAGALTGRKTAVPQAGSSGELVVVARGPEGAELRLVDPAVATLVGETGGIDPSRPADTVELADAESRQLVGPSETPAVLAGVRRLALTLLACEAVGVAARALDQAVEHARIRTQFGRPIGANQAVSHPLAETYAQVELARSLAYRSAWAVHADPDPARVDEAVACATVAARDAALGACETGMQTLGAIGVTWEHPIHHWYRRALWITSFEGPAAGFRAELAALLCDGPASPCQPTSGR